MTNHSESLINKRATAVVDDGERLERGAHREHVLEKFAALTGAAITFAPVVAEAVITSRHVRRGLVRTAGTAAFRMNPIVLAFTVASVGIVGYRLWQRRARAVQQRSTRELVPTPREDSIATQKARMENEGSMPGDYDATSLGMNSLSRN